MFRLSISFIVIAAMLFIAGSAVASSVSVKVSGPGAVNDTTIKKGQPVSFDIYIANDKKYTCFTMGFKMTSDDIKTIVHLADSGKGNNPKGDVKGWNGFEDASIWDLGGLHVVQSDWDGKLPELVGFGGLCAYKTYEPHENKKCLSWDVRFDEVGTIVVDSSFFPPGGKWIMGQPAHEPLWGGPYKFTVVE